MGVHTRLKSWQTNEVATENVLSRARRASWVLLPRSLRRCLHVAYRRAGGLGPSDSLMYFRAAADAIRRTRYRWATRELDTATMFLVPHDRGIAGLLRDVLREHAITSNSAARKLGAKDAGAEFTYAVSGLRSAQLAPLSQGAASVGCFYFGFTARSLALTRSCEEVEYETASSQVVNRAVFYHIEQGDLPAAMDLIDQLRARRCAIPPGVVDAIVTLGLSPSGYIQEAPSTTDTTFAEMVMGRRVVLVGAAPTDEEHLVNASDYDCVIRMTPALCLEGQPDEKLGRCDIAYLTTLSPAAQHRLSAHFGGARLSFRAVQTPKVIVMKKAKALGQLSGVPIRSIPNRRVAAIGSPTSGTQAIVDILLHAPKQLDLCGFNFYTSQATYSPEIQNQKRTARGLSGAGRDFLWTDRGLHPSVHAIQWAAHDLASDFMFLRSLIDHNTRVRALGRAKEVLQWSLERYYERFEELYQGLD